MNTRKFLIFLLSFFLSLNLYANDNIQNAKKFSDSLFRNASDPFIGNSKAPITIVEFMDFTCPYCKRSQAAINQISQNYPNVKIVFKQLPIHGEPSILAAKIALAANLQGKYWQMHTAMMHLADDNFSQNKLLQIAKTQNLNVAELKRDMNSNAISDLIKANKMLAKQLQILGTPAFYIASSQVNDKTQDKFIYFVIGQISQQSLSSRIQHIEENQ